MDPTNLPANTDHPHAADLDPNVQELLGAPHLLEGESAERYNAFHRMVRAAMAPTDFVEEIWARDFTELTWDILRLRRYKASNHEYYSTAGFRVLAQEVKDEKRRERLIADFISGKPAARKRIDKFIGGDVSAWDTIGARTLEENFDTSERFERLIAQAESRRNALLREIDRHRDSAVARRPRQALHEVQDAEFEEVMPDPPAE